MDNAEYFQRIFRNGARSGIDSLLWEEEIVTQNISLCASYVIFLLLSATPNFSQVRNWGYSKGWSLTPASTLLQPRQGVWCFRRLQSLAEHQEAEWYLSRRLQETHSTFYDGEWKRIWPVDVKDVGGSEMKKGISDTKKPLPIRPSGMNFI
jgi:hypothetical protein